MPTIERLTALEILDSRGRPTVQASCLLAGGARGTASAPSGASTGAAEALELRDGDPARYGGLGCRRAVAHVAGEINNACAGRSFAAQADLDGALIALDGTPNKARLGANALLSVSLAFARAVAAEQGLPLYQSLATLIGQPLTTLPRPTVNLFSGGKHAGGQTPIQDLLVVPASARTMDEALAMVYAVYQAAIAVIAERYGARPLVADEGGLAPPFGHPEAMFDDAVTAIIRAGLTPGRDVALAVDVAATHFYHDGAYNLAGRRLNTPAMIEQVLAWVQAYPVVSVEDGLAQDAWDDWPTLRASLAGRALTLGDDLLCTNPSRIRRAISLGAADALLLKVNQIGTLTEAAEACQLARAAGWPVTVSARSGDTEDDWLADLAVGWAGDTIKVGSITRSERLAKYNRLLAIEAETGLPLAVGPSRRP